ncbi:MAG: DUF563 domain-containing protein [Rubellimicrobium sp.]|nr:DUF563 domain-containing protein [Rubellimicrobium sp.]
MIPIQLRAECLPERTAFVPMPDLVDRLMRGEAPPAGEPGTGHWAEIEPPGMVQGHPAGDVVLVHLRNAVVWPGRGIVMGPDGRVVQATELGGRLSREKFRRLWGIQRTATGPRFLPREATSRLPRAMVWMNAGADVNYGHFMFDALPALYWADRIGLLERFTPIAPFLDRWQRDLIRRAGISRAPREARDDVILVEELILTTAQNHYLHRNAALSQALGARLAAGATSDGPPVYLSRRGLTGRVMVNERALEAALADRGVRILRPGRMRVADQAAAMAGAPVILGPSGAALANLMFVAPGTRVIEIRPDPVREPWMDLACAARDLDHVVVPAEAPLPKAEIPLWVRTLQLPRRLTARYHYAVRVDIDAVMAALDAS